MGEIGINPVVESQFQQGRSSQRLIQGQGRKIHKLSLFVVQGQQDDLLHKGQHVLILSPPPCETSHSSFRIRPASLA